MLLGKVTKDELSQAAVPERSRISPRNSHNPFSLAFRYRNCVTACAKNSVNQVMCPHTFNGQVERNDMRDSAAQCGAGKTIFHLEILDLAL